MGPLHCGYVSVILWWYVRYNVVMCLLYCGGVSITLWLGCVSVILCLCVCYTEVVCHVSVTL